MPVISIVGNSGDGKTTSIFKNDALGIKGVDLSRTKIINVMSKDLPVKGGAELFKNKTAWNISNPDEVKNFITKFMENDNCDTLIIDDAQYITAMTYMAKANEKGYEKFTQMAAKLFDIIKEAQKCPLNKNIIFFWHPESDGNGRIKIKTIGKMIDSTISLEGIFTIILHTYVYSDEQGKVHYNFRTATDGVCLAKAPFGMFDEPLIPNDLGYVIEKVKEYYG
jgi:hypothetical protein